MRNLTILAALGLAAAAGTANAGVTSTVTLTNDYDFRGITQTDEDPAIQASVDFATDSGWYIGAWASNVDFPGYDGDIELDLYTGFTGSTGDTSVTVPLPSNFSILGHVGYSDGDAIDILYGDSYTDYSVGVGYAAGKFSLALKFVGTDGVDDSLGLDDSRAVFTIATTFPWAG